MMLSLTLNLELTPSGDQIFRECFPIGYYHQPWRVPLAHCSL